MVLEREEAKAMTRPLGALTQSPFEYYFKLPYEVYGVSKYEFNLNPQARIFKYERGYEIPSHYYNLGKNETTYKRDFLFKNFWHAHAYLQKLRAELLREET